MTLNEYELAAVEDLRAQIRKDADLLEQVVYRRRRDNARTSILDTGMQTLTAPQTEALAALREGTLTAGQLNAAKAALQGLRTYLDGLV